jgi:hypothetical protein
MADIELIIDDSELVLQFDTPESITRVSRGFSFNDSATIAMDYYSNNVQITNLTGRNINNLFYSTDGGNLYNEIILPLSSPITVNNGDIFWKIVYTAGKSSAFLEIKGKTI